MNPGTLKEISIQEAFQKGLHHKALVDEADHLRDIEQLSHKIHETDFVVSNAQKEFVGIISFKDFYYDREAIESIEDITVAKDLISRSLPSSDTWDWPSRNAQYHQPSNRIRSVNALCGARSQILRA